MAKRFPNPYPGLALQSWTELFHSCSVYFDKVLTGFKIFICLCSMHIRTVQFSESIKEVMSSLHMEKNSTIDFTTSLSEINRELLLTSLRFCCIHLHVQLSNNY